MRNETTAGRSGHRHVSWKLMFITRRNLSSELDLRSIKTATPREPEIRRSERKGEGTAKRPENRCTHNAREKWTSVVRKGEQCNIRLIDVPKAIN